MIKDSPVNCRAESISEVGCCKPNDCMDPNKKEFAFDIILYDIKVMLLDDDVLILDNVILFDAGKGNETIEYRDIKPDP